MKMTIEDLSAHARELYDIIKDAHRKAVLLRQAADNYDQHYTRLPFDYSTGCEAGLERAFDEIQQVYEAFERVRYDLPDVVVISKGDPLPPFDFTDLDGLTEE